MRDSDSNVKRQKNKPLRQFEKNLFETNFFSSVGIIISLFNDKGLDYAKVKLIPSVRYKDFDFQSGYTNKYPANPIVNALISKDVAKSSVKADAIVLIIFTDNDFKGALQDIVAGSKLNNDFYTDNTEKNTLGYGIITNVIL